MNRLLPAMLIALALSCTVIVDDDAGWTTAQPIVTSADHGESDSEEMVEGEVVCRNPVNTGFLAIEAECAAMHLQLCELGDVDNNISLISGTVCCPDLYEGTACTTEPLFYCEGPPDCPDPGTLFRVECPAGSSYVCDYE